MASKSYTLLEYLVTIEMELKKLKKVVAESVGADYSELIANIDGIRNELNTFKTTITNTVDNNNTEITSKFNNLEQQFNTFKTSITNTVNSNKSEITSQVNTLTTNFNSFKTTLESQVSGLTTRVTNVENRVTTLENNGGITGGTVDLTEVNNRISTNENNIKTLQTDVTSLKSRVSSLENNTGSSGGSDGGSREQLIVSYTHTSNKVIQPINLDYSTGIWETREPHTLQTGNKLILDFLRGDKQNFEPRNIVNEIFTFNWTTWYFLLVEVIDDTHFKLKNNSDNSYLSYSTTNNSNVDFSKFRFQVASSIKLTNLDLSQYKKLKFVVRYLTMSQGYVNATKVLKLNGIPQPPFYRPSGNKLFSVSDLGALLYHNNTYDTNSSFGHAGVYRDDYIVNEITIEENKVTNKSMCSSYGVNKTYTNHDNNSVVKNYSFYKEALDCGYAQGNAFLDEINIGDDQKILNGSYIEIYSI